MADTRVTMCGLEFKNPILSAADDFGSTARMARRVVEQGIGGLVSKTVHRIPGMGQWPRPWHFPIKKFGEGHEQGFICSELYCHIEYDRWLNEEAPKMVKLCRENDVRFIVSMSGLGTEFETWGQIARDLEQVGAEMLELNLGGPHAKFQVREDVEVGRTIGMDPDLAHKVVEATVKAVSIPVMCKMTPMSEIALVALACERAGAGAISANNSLYGMHIDVETGTPFGNPCVVGCLMGRNFKNFSLAKVTQVTSSVKIPVSGIGGVWIWDDVVEYIMAGCSTVQVCSAKYLKGVKVLGEMLEGLEAFMDRKGYSSVEEFRGLALEKVMVLRDLPKEDRISLPSPIQPQFDMEACTGCGLCEELCPYAALTVDTEKGNRVDEEYCLGCGMCVGQCPEDAIKLVHLATGNVVWENRGLHRIWVKD